MKQTNLFSLLYEPLSILNYKLMLDGINKVKDKSVIIAGCMRDVKPNILTHNLGKCVRIGNVFGNYRIIIVENDSQTKSTLDISKNKNITLINKHFGWPRLGDGRDYRRTLLMSEIRNIYYNIIKTDYYDYDYVMIIDYDIQNWRLDGVFNSLGMLNWDMIGANGIQSVDGKELYYDTFALIEKDYKTYERGVDHKKYDLNTQLHPVLTCFGGIGLYKMNAFLAGRRYSTATLDGNNISEQCSIFHNMHKSGYNNIYINPNMVVLR